MSRGAHHSVGSTITVGWSSDCGGSACGAVAADSIQPFSCMMSRAREAATVLGNSRLSRRRTRRAEGHSLREVPARVLELFGGERLFDAELDAAGEPGLLGLDRRIAVEFLDLDLGVDEPGGVVLGPLEAGDVGEDLEAPGAP